MTVKRVTCVGCGDTTTFTDGTPDNNHILLTGTNPNTYNCKGCGLQSGNELETFREETLVA
jgi:hypothetical protein